LEGGRADLVGLGLRMNLACALSAWDAPGGWSGPSPASVFLCLCASPWPAVTAGTSVGTEDGYTSSRWLSGCTAVA